jgi:hypothetical protein
LLALAGAGGRRGQLQYDKAFGWREVAIRRWSWPTGRWQDAEPEISDGKGFEANVGQNAAFLLDGEHDEYPVSSIQYPVRNILTCDVGAATSKEIS